jgi:hypothetical protein
MVPNLRSSGSANHSYVDVDLKAYVGIIPTDTWMIGKIKIYCARINPRKRRKWITSILLAIRSSQVFE